MAQKWNLQDIVPPERPRKTTARRSVDGAAPRAPRTSRKTKTEEAPLPPPEAPLARTSRPVSYDTPSVTPKRYVVVSTIVGIILLIGLGIALLLRGAEVTVTPKTYDATLKGEFTAKLAPTGTELGYELLTLEEVGTRQVPATGEEEVAESARGTVTLKNAYSSTPQRLITNTRFEAPDGRIYRIASSAVIPGYTKNAAGEIVPGSVKAEVFADGTGDTYNITNATLKAPGLKGGEQYERIYAEVDAIGIQGGYVGTRFIIDEKELARARQELQGELREKLSGRVTNERPNGFVLYENAVTFSYESLPAEEAGEKMALIKERARLHAPLFNEVNLASFIARNTVSGYMGESVRIQHPDTLRFTYTDPTFTSLPGNESIAFSLEGKAHIVWNFDKAALIKDLTGLPEDDLRGVLERYPAIDRAEAVIRPIWKSSFPQDPAKIKVMESIPGAGEAAVDDNS